MFNSLARITILFGGIVKILCILSPEDIHEVTESLEVDENKKQMLKFSIINPICGYLFEATGALHNIRFFGPLLELGQGDDYKRNYSNDSSDDDVVKLAILLFPSPTGTLCHIRNTFSNFGSKIQNQIKDKGKGIKIMSDLFLQALNTQTKTDSEDGNVKDEIKQVKSILIRKNKTLVFSDTDSQIIKLSMIHSFMINVLDNKDHLKEYLINILNNSTGIENIPLLNNVEAAGQVVKFRKQYDSFPYSLFDQPPSNSKIPLYYWQTGTYDKEKTFSDCADVLLLNLCNCLLYDSSKLNYSVEKLDPNSEIYKFYQKYNFKNLHIITDEIRNDWSKVVQGLDNFATKDASKYKLNEILYMKKDLRNEVGPGIINMMNILIKICNIDHEGFWKDFNGIRDTERKLLELFNMISSCKSKISIKNCRLKEEEIGTRFEILGDFEIYFELKDMFALVIRVEQTSKHAEMKVTNYQVGPSKIQNIKAIEEKNLLDNIYMNYVQKFERADLKNNDNLASTAYFKLPMYNYLVKAYILRELNKFENDQRLKEILKGIKVSILETINLRDPIIGERFIEDFIYLDGFTDQEITAFWKNSFSLSKTASTEVYQLWSSRLKETKTSEIQLDDFIAEVFIPSIFETLSELPSLESLNLKFWHSDPETTSAILQNLGNLSQLKTLAFIESLSSCISEDPIQIKHLLESLLKLKNLESLELSQSYLSTNLFNEEELYSLLISRLQTLTKLKISEVEFSESEMKFLAKILVQLKNLKILQIECLQSSNTFDGFECFTTVLSQMNNLVEFSISDVKFDDKGRGNCLADAIGQLQNLQTLSIKTTGSLNPEAAKNLALNISKLKILNKLCLFTTSTSDSLTNYISKTISQLTNLVSLDIAESGSVCFVYITRLCEALKDSQNLKSLSISVDSYMSGSIKNFAKSLRNLNQLVKLDIFKLFIKNHDDMKQVIDVVQELTSLKTLSFPRCFRNINDLAVYSNCIEKLPNLESLTIYLKDSSAEEIKSFSEQLGKLTNLRNLNLSSFNETLWSAERRCFYEAIRKMKQLTSLKVSKNLFEPENIKYLLEVLGDLEKLSLFDVGNSLSNLEAVRTLKDKFKNLMISNCLDVW